RAGDHRWQSRDHRGAWEQPARPREIPRRHRRPDDRRAEHPNRYPAHLRARRRAETDSSLLSRRSEGRRRGRRPRRGTSDTAMKKSRAVHVPLVSTLAAAALAAGCGSSPAPPQLGWQTCVDRPSGTAVEQRYCDDETTRLGRPGYVPHYFWYYYPRMH